MPFDAKKRAFLVDAMGEEFIAQLKEGISELDATLKAQGYRYKAMPASPVAPYLAHMVQFLRIDASPEQVTKSGNPVLQKAIRDVNDLLAGLKGQSVPEEEEAPVEPEPAPETAASPFAQDVVDRLSGKALTPGQKAMNELGRKALNPS